MQDLEFLVPQFEKPERPPIWYVYAGLVGAIFVAFAWLTQNYTFIPVVLLIAAVLAIRNNRKPDIIMVAIHDDGIYVQNKLYKYADLKNYSIAELDGKNYLIFIGKSSMQLPLKIPVENPALIRAKLNNLLTEVEYQESLIDTVIRWIRL